MTDEIELRHVVNWITASASHGYGILELQYLANPMDKPELALGSPTFALTSAQLRELGTKLVWLAEQVEAIPIPGAGLPKH